ncbi:MAG: CPBP family intramembrane metalloprotease [Oscillospiraceae bacterium]|nr:CPBP family intramembrane metalloprotease [Oscillospiraceae bacterium]
MEQLTNSIASSNEVSVKPDKEEKKSIRRKYLKVGFVIIFNMAMFNIISMVIIYLIGGIYGGDLSSFSAITKGTAKLLSNSDISVIMSCLIPIISESLSIFLGCKLLKLDLRSLFNRDGYTGGTVCKVTTIGLGIQTAASLVAQIIAMILAKFGLESSTADLSVGNSSAWSVIPLYLYACLLGPLLEELLYRGVLLQGLRKYNERFAIVISALIFGLMHQNYQQFIFAFSLGLILGAITLKSESIIPSLVTHIIANTTGVLIDLAMQCADYEAYEKVATGSLDFTSSSIGFAVTLALNALFRYGFLILGGIFLIIALVKKGNVRKPTPAGKSRGWPILAQSWIWYIIFIGYIYLAFIEPIHKI